MRLPFMKTFETLWIACALLLVVAASAQQSPASAPTGPNTPAMFRKATRGASLYRALRSNNTAAVKRLLKQGVDLNDLYQPPILDVRSTAYHAAPFLYWALLFRCGDETLKALVGSGADVNFRFREPEDVTLLMQAAHQFPAASLRFLLDHGARINDQTRSGRTALMVAVTDGDPSLGERYGADPRANAALLISRGARVGVRDSRGKTAAMVAALDYGGSAELLAGLLARGAKVNEADDEGVTLLMYASTPANLKAVNLLLRRGASVTARDTEGRTALMHALYPHCGKVDLPGVVGALCKAGVDVNARDRQGETALDYMTQWEDRLGSARPLLESFHAVHGSGPTRVPGLDRSGGTGAGDERLAFSQSRLPRWPASTSCRVWRAGGRTSWRPRQAAAPAGPGDD
jgi:ankyrin repeat protein